MRKLLLASMVGAVFAGVAAAASEPHSAIGFVQLADPAARTVTLAHQPVPSLNWPSTTTQFSVLEPGLLERLPMGQQIAFEFVQQPNGWRIVNAIPLAQSTVAATPAPQSAPPRHMDMASMHRMCMDIMSQMENRRR